MIHVSYTNLRKQLAHYLDRANDDRDAILITRQGSEPVVMLAQAEYDSMCETLHLLSSSANAARLQAAIDEANSGKRGIEVEWDEASGAYKPL